MFGTSRCGWKSVLQDINSSVLLNDYCGVLKAKQNFISTQILKYYLHVQQHNKNPHKGGKPDVDSNEPAELTYVGFNKCNNWFSWNGYGLNVFVKHLWPCFVPVCVTDSTVPCAAEPSKNTRQIHAKLGSSRFISVTVIRDNSHLYSRAHKRLRTVLQKHVLSRTRWKMRVFLALKCKSEPQHL